MTDSKPLSGKLALVTGASRGIGAATAEALAREGAHVILVARTATALEEVEDRIHAAGGSATIAPLDLTSCAGCGSQRNTAETCCTSRGAPARATLRLHHCPAHRAGPQG